MKFIMLEICFFRKIHTWKRGGGHVYTQNDALPSSRLLIYKPFEFDGMKSIAKACIHLVYIVHEQQLANPYDVNLQQAYRMGAI